MTVLINQDNTQETLALIEEPIAPATKENELQLQSEVYGTTYQNVKDIRDIATQEYTKDIENTRMEALRLNLINEKITPAEAKAIVDVYSNRIEDNSKVSLENLAAQESYGKAITNPDNAATVEAFSLADLSEAFEDTIAKRNLESTLIAKVTDEVAGESWTEASPIEQIGIGAKEALDLLPKLLPFYETVQDYKAFTVSPTGEKVGYSFLPSQVRDEQRDVIIRARATMSSREYQQFLQTIDDGLKSSLFIDKYTRQKFWEDMFSYKTHFDDFTQVVDAIPLAGAVIAGIAKGSSKVFDIIKDFGKVDDTVLDRKKAAGDIAGAKQILKEMVDSPDADTAKIFENTIPTAMQPNNNKVMSDTNLQSSVFNDMMDKAANSALGKLILNTPKFENDLEAFGEQAIQAAQEKLIRRMGGKVKAKEVMDNLTWKFETVSGEMSSTFVIGRGGSNVPFSNMNAARTAAVMRYKLKEGEYLITHDSPAGYLIKAHFKAPMKLDDTRAENANGFYSMAGLNKIFGFKYTPKNFRDRRELATNVYSTIRNQMQHTISKYNKLDRSSKDALDRVLADMQDSRLWFNEDYLRSYYGLSDKAIEVVDEYHNANDVLYLLDNATTRNNYDMRGFRGITTKTLSDEGEEVVKTKIGRIIDYPETSKISQYTYKIEGATDGKSFYNVGEMTPEVLSGYKNSGYEIIEEATNNISTVKLGDGTTEAPIPIKYTLVKKSSVEINELPEYVLPYIEGGHRYYQPGAYYLKMANVVDRGNGIPPMVFTPKTLRTSLDREKLQEFADEFNELARIYKAKTLEGWSKEEAIAKFSEYASSTKYLSDMTYQDFKDKVSKGVFNLKYPVEVVEDGGDMAATRGLKDALFMNDPDSYFSSQVQEMLNDATEFYNSRGAERLKDVFGEPAQVLDFRRTFNRTVNRLAASSSIGEYNKWAVNEFMLMFGDTLRMDSVKNLSPREIIFNAKLSHSDPKHLRAAENCLEQLRQFNRTPSAWDDIVTKSMRGVADILSKSSKAIGQNWFEMGGTSWNAVRDFRPDRFLSSLAFHTYLGFLNPRQLWLQGLGALNTVAISPKYGSKAASVSMAVDAILKSDKTISWSKNPISNAFAKLSGTSKEELMEIAEAMKKIYVTDAVQLQPEYINLPQNMDNLRRLERLSLAPFNLGERFNYLTAEITAYLEWKARNPNKVFDKIDDIIDVQGRASDMYLHMSRANNTALQNNLGAIPTSVLTQFSSYKLRMIETLLGKTLTPEEKIRLFATNLALYGVHGSVTADVFNVYSFMTDDVGMDTDTAKHLSYGLGDALLEALDIDASLSQEGPALAPSWFKWFADNPANTDILSIPGIEALVNTVRSAETAVDASKFVSSKIFNIFQDAKEFYNPETSSTDLLKFARSIQSKGMPSSLRNATKFYIALKTGKIYTNQGEILAKDLSALDATMKLFGMRTRTERDVEALYSINRDFDRSVADITSDLQEYWGVWLNTKSHEALQDFLLLRNALKESVSPKMFDAVMKKFRYKDMEETVKDAQFQRLYMKQGSEAFLKQRQTMGE